MKSDGAVERLWGLVDERRRGVRPKDEVDAQIWREFGAEASVVYTDLGGFSRQVAKFGIIHFLEIIHRQREVFGPLIATHGGTLLKIEADSLLISFKDPRSALACTMAMRAKCRDENVGRAPEEHLILCAGIGHGRVLAVSDVDMFGQEVNSASKLGEDAAKGNEILVTPAFHAALGEVDGVRWTPFEAGIVGAETCYRLD